MINYFINQRVMVTYTALPVYQLNFIDDSFTNKWLFFYIYNPSYKNVKLIK